MKSKLRLKGAGAAVLLLSSSLSGGLAYAVDVFNTHSQVSQNPASPLLQGTDGAPCSFGAVTVPLQLFEAIERTLCQSPKTRSAWAGVKAAAAAVGAAKAAYLPTVEGAASYGRDHDRTTVNGPQQLASDYTQTVDTESLQLGWVLYDFGGREATLRNSRQLLTAAQAEQNEILQNAFANTAKDYYAAQAASAKVQSTKRIETGAKKSFDAAVARYNSGVAPVTDQLQAKTAYAQAVYERAAAEGAYRIALGALATDMNMPPDHPLTMPNLDEGVLPDTQFVVAVHDLVEEAKHAHPAVQAAYAQWQAALASVSLTEAQGLPKIGVTGTLERSKQPLNADIGTLTYPSISKSASIGLTLQVPIFEGFARTYSIHQAKALAEEQEAAFHDAEQQVSTTVWTSYQTLETDTENLRNTQTISQSAGEAFEASQQRYSSGVGNILELLTAQTTLANAEQLRIQAQADWRTARLQLAASLGKLGMWAVK
jgi:outer membrane protein